MKKKLPLIVAALAVAAFVGWRWKTSGEFRYAGTVEATDVDLSPRISSQLSAVTVHEGDTVKSGQLVIELGCEDLKLAADIAEAKAMYAPDAAWDPLVLALFTQATLQGAFILAKAQGSATIVAQCIDHLRQHVANLLGADARPAQT